MYSKSHREASNRKYVNHACMIQSSGSGKSRLVDMVAETIFTIPFNVREARDAASELFPNLMTYTRSHPKNAGKAWPPADDVIQHLLVTLAQDSNNASSLHTKYLCFFQAVFEETRKEVEHHGNQAKAWREHLK